MQSRNKFLSFFGVRQEESGTVGMFFLHHFFLGLGQAMFFIAAITKFLEKLTPEYLSKVFVLSAIVLMVVGRIYAYYEHTLPFKILLPKVILVLIGIAVIFRFAFYFVKDDAPLLVLFEIAFFIVYLLCNLEFWGLSALVFDVRQGKRLFSLISSGDVPAKMLGYLCVYLFTLHEKENLLIISAIAFIISYFILKNLLPKIDIGHHTHTAEHVASKSQNTTKFQGLQDFFGNRFILNLSILSFLYYAVFIMIEFLYYCKIKEHTEVQADTPLLEQGLANRLGIFLGISYALIFILKLLYSGRLLNRIGVQRALLAMPVILGSLSFIYFFYGSAENNNSNIFYIGIMAMTAFVFKYALNDPTFLVLFQPMPVRFRLQGHTVIKAFVQSVALALTGLTLWASYVYWGDKVNFFYYLNFEIFILIAGWVGFVFVCYKNYIEVLNEAIKKRFITGTELAFNDASYLNILKEKLNSNVPEEILFAMNTLDKLEPHAIKVKIPELLSNAHEGVIAKAVELIAIHKWTNYLPNLYAKLSVISSQQSVSRSDVHLSNNYVSNSNVQNSKRATHNEQNTTHNAQLISACCTLDDDAYDKLEPYFDKQEPSLQKSLIVGFINSDDLNARIQVEQLLLRLILSNNNSDKILACEIIGELKNPSLQKNLFTLINDGDDMVSLAAIKAAGQIKAAKLIPVLFDKMKQPRFKKQTIYSLGLYGDKLDVKHWSELVKDSTPEEQNPLSTIFDFIKISEKTGGKLATKFLMQELSANYNNVPVRGAVVAGLNVLSFKPALSENKIFNNLLDTEFVHAHTLLNATFNYITLSPRMQAAIHHEFNICITRIFQLFRLLYPTDTIKKAESAVYLAEKEKKANGLEILDNIIPKKVYSNISILLENIPEDIKIQQLKKFNAPVEPPDFSLYIVQLGEKQFTKWTIGLALREGEISSENFPNYSSYLNDKSILLRQSSWESISNFKKTKPDIYKSIADNKTQENMNIKQNQNLTDIEKVFVLKSTQLFSETPENIIAEIVPIVKEVAVSKGDIIFNKGDNGSSMYIIYEGIVKIHDGEKTFIENKNRDFFGELALLDPEPRSASATALTDTLLLKLEEEEWYELMEERPEVLRSIMRILCRRIRHQNDLLIR